MMDDDEDDGRTDDPFRERKEPQSKQRHHEDQMALAAKCQCRWWVPCIFFCDPSTPSPSSGATTHGTFRTKKKKENREEGAGDPPPPVALKKKKKKETGREALCAAKKYHSRPCKHTYPKLTRPPYRGRAV